jgi:transcriptional regulator
VYLPKLFEETRPEVLHALIRAHPLGAWVAWSGDGLVANNIPFLLDAQRGELGTLCCHVARPNPVAALAGKVPSVVSFQGPQTYVTPSWYPSKQADGKVVPTWNYAVVHVHGHATFIDDRVWLLQHVGQLTDAQESGREHPWQVGDAPADYIDRMVRAIVGVEIRIERIEGKWKTSQNRNEADKRGVLQGLHERGDDQSLAMASLVGRHIEPSGT